MHIGTNQRIGELVMRHGLWSQRAPLDCTSSRRSTVMRALPWATRVTTEYQRDSSSKRPISSVTLAARRLYRPWNLPIGIGEHLAMSPLPHHRAYWSVPRRFGQLSRYCGSR
jgi:hypothetical protein